MSETSSKLSTKEDITIILKNGIIIKGVAIITGITIIKDKIIDTEYTIPNMHFYISNGKLIKKPNSEIGSEFVGTLARESLVVEKPLIWEAKLENEVKT